MRKLVLIGGVVVLLFICFVLWATVAMDYGDSVAVGTYSLAENGNLDLGSQAGPHLSTGSQPGDKRVPQAIPTSGIIPGRGYATRRICHMQKVRVHCFGVSLDGYGAGPSQSLEHPLGVAASG